MTTAHVGQSATEQHFRAVCPCRQRHTAAPKPVPPDAPAGAGKRARVLRTLLEATHSSGESHRIVHVDPDLILYSEAYARYLVAFTDWSPELCGNCGVSLLCPNPSLGCPRCWSADAEALLTEAVQKAVPS